MKNENKIIELLTEYISRTDKMEQEFSQEITQLRKDLNQEVVTLRKDLNQTNVRQEELMKEIFRISRRVGNLEDKTDND